LRASSVSRMSMTPHATPSRASSSLTIARCAGLVGHAYEESANPAMRAIWEAAEKAVPYDGDR